MFASLTGQVMATEQMKIDDTTESNSNENDNDTWIVSIEQSQQQTSQSAYAKASNSISPNIGSLILGRVTRVVRPSYAVVDIIAMLPNETNAQSTKQSSPSNNNNEQQQQQPGIIPFHEPYAGTLRQNEIKPQSALELDLSECIRPGDIILARIHALGGEKEYILSTAETELGVIKAVCESSGYELRPVSYKEMECVVSGVREGRKVAKPRVGV